jgi:hypothetical protein
MIASCPYLNFEGRHYFVLTSLAKYPKETLDAATILAIYVAVMNVNLASVLNWYKGGTLSQRRYHLSGFDDLQQVR